MSLFKRNCLNLGNQRVESNSGKGLEGLHNSNPLSSNYRPPISEPTIRRIYQYFIAVQKARYGDSIDLSREIVSHHINLALKDHDAGWLLRAIKYTSWISEYPYSIHFAIKALLKYESENGYQPRGDQKASAPAQSIKLLWD